MDPKTHIKQVEKMLFGWSMILFPLMLLLGFLMHPSIIPILN